MRLACELTRGGSFESREKPNEAETGTAALPRYRVYDGASLGRQGALL